LIVPIYRLGNITPRIDPSAYVAPGATVLGDAELAAGTTVWFGATIRADNDLIRIGAGSNIQDGAVLHTDPGFPLVVGTNVSVGHQAMLHGCTIGEGSLIGIQAVLLNGSVIGRHCLVGAGAVVTEGKNFPDNVLILGAPAKAIRELEPAERDKLLEIAARYSTRGEYYRHYLQPV
jgi:carbonic anhydrase/acetyltransferase-like protein (isoleucine patch superfamily)